MFAVSLTVGVGEAALGGSLFARTARYLKEDAALESSELIEHYPRLHHMAEAGSWPAIQQVGLMTTEQIVDACAPDEATREAILRQRRPRSYTLQHPVLGPVTVRDQGPLKEHNLRPALRDMTVQEWLEVLNNRVFFWLHPERLNTLLAASLYRDATHDVLVLDTADLIAAHKENIRIAGMNTGATIFPNATERGSNQGGCKVDLVAAGVSVLT